jgi:uncharacterized membrane protein
MTRRETRKRSVLKTITWRLLATITTISLVYVFTQNLEIALGIGGLEMVLKIVIYYLHERGWNIVEWGMMKSMMEVGVRK